MLVRLQICNSILCVGHHHDTFTLHEHVDVCNSQHASETGQFSGTAANDSDKQCCVCLLLTSFYPGSKFLDVVLACMVPSHISNLPSLESLSCQDQISNQYSYVQFPPFPAPRYHILTFQPYDTLLSNKHSRLRQMFPTGIRPCLAVPSLLLAFCS